MLEAIQEHLVGRITFPLSNHLMNRRGIGRKYRSLMYTDHATAERLRAAQRANLRRVLARAARWCPYYTSSGSRCFRAKT
jgi:hypothetical protein